MKKYQAIAFLLSTAMTVSSAAPVFGASNDIFGHWAEFTITKWQQEGKIGGYEDGSFKPDKAITRAEFIRLLNNAVPTAFTSNSSVNFSDVKENDWFFADVSKAVENGITSGFEDGTFRPSETVTRIQAAVFIAKAKGLTANEAAANSFTDVAQIPAWAKGAVGAAVSAGYLSGYPDGSFGGNRGMTRAEAVSTLDRVLGGTSTSNQTPSQGEVDTTDRDNQQKEETTAKAGDMVWTSGGSGGGRKSSSSSGGSSSNSSSNTVSGAVEIRSQSDADNYKGKTLTGKATIYATDGLELQDIRFKGDVDIIAESSTVASAYEDSNIAVAAAYLSDIKIYFEGRTNISGTITVIKDNVPLTTQVVIITRTPRTINAALKAFHPVRIVGFELNKVEANAPIEVAENAKVNTITANNDASVVVESGAEVKNIDVAGAVSEIVLNSDTDTNVTINDNAEVSKIELNNSAAATIAVNGNAVLDTIAISNNANAKVNVNDNATVEKVDISDTATANVAITEDAKVNTVTSTSTGKTAISGTGTVNKIEASNPNTINKTEEVTTPVDSTTTAPVTPTTKTATAKAAKETINWSIGSMTSYETSNTEILFEGVKVKTDATYEDLKIEQSSESEGIVAMPEAFKGKVYVFFQERGTVKEGSYTYTLIIPAEILEAESGYTVPKDGFKVTITINASNPVPSKIEVDKTAVTIKKGGQVEIKAVLKDQNGNEIKSNGDGALIQTKADEGFPEEVFIFSGIANGTTIDMTISVPANAQYTENMTLPIIISTTDKVETEVPPVTINVTLSTDDTTISGLEFKTYDAQENSIDDVERENFEPNDEIRVVAQGKDGNILVSPLVGIGTLTWTLEENGKEVTDTNIADMQVIENCDKCIVTIGEGVTSNRTFTLTAKFVQKGSTNEVTNRVTIKARAKSVPSKLGEINNGTGTLELEKGQTKPLSTEILSQYDEQIAGKVKWSIDNADVGTFEKEIVDETSWFETTFTVTGNAEDTATITATLVDENNDPIVVDGKEVTQTVQIVVVDPNAPDEPTDVIETSTSVAIKNDELMIELSDVTVDDITKATSKAGAIKIIEKRHPENVWTCDVLEDNSATITLNTSYIYETNTLVIHIPFEYFKKGSESFDYDTADVGTYNIITPEGMFSYDGKPIIVWKAGFCVEIEAKVTTAVMNNNAIFNFKDKNDNILTNLALIDEEPKATIELVKYNETDEIERYISKPLSNDDIKEGVISIPISDFTDENGNHPVAGQTYDVESWPGSGGEGFVDITTESIDDCIDSVNPTFDSLTIPAEPSGLANRSNPADPSKPADPSEPTDPSKPANLSEPTKPSDPAEPSNPAEPSDSTEPSDPADSSDSTEPVQPSDSTGLNNSNDKPELQL